MSGLTMLISSMIRSWSSENKTLRLSLLSSPRAVKSFPKFRYNMECRVYPRILLAAIPVKAALATIGLSRLFAPNRNLMMYSRASQMSLINLDLPVPKYR